MARLQSGVETGTTLVISPHGALEPWAFQYKKWKKRIAWWTYQRRVLRRADLIIVNSQQERAALRDLKLGGPIAVISNGVDISTCPDWVLTGKQSVPREKIILFLARLTPKKGIPDLLLAWSNLADRKGHVLHIHGFGDAAYSRLLQDRIDELAISEHVKLLPALFGEEKWKRYASASAYVLPSYSENFGITVAEALVAGLPVITTKATPWSDLPAERIGWIVENDVAQLGIALTAALSMTEAQREQMADAARKYAAKRFLWPAIVEKYLEAYRWTTNPSANTPAWLDHG